MIQLALILALSCLALPARADMASDVLRALDRARSTWWVEARCQPGGFDACYFKTNQKGDPMPSPEACAQYGRKLQLSRRAPMNDFRCIEVKP